MKVWITKYALTQGIHEAEVEECEDSGMVQQKGSSFYHGEGKQWHRTREGAVAKADEMRKKKIESLKKKITNLEKMNFS